MKAILSRRRMAAALATALVGAAVAAAPARAEFPEKPVKLVVPFAPGGPTDALARHLGEALRVRLGQTVIVDNRGGAGGNIGAEVVATAPADGYTLLFGTSGPLAINVSLFPKLGYDPIRSFEPVIMIGNLPNVLAVNPAVPARTLAELVTLCRREPGKLTYGSSGPGGLLHLGTEFFLDAAGIKATHVPYRGTALALADLLAGNLQMLSGGTTTMLPYIKSGKLRALAVSSKKRLAAAPDIPSYGEQGYLMLDFNLWHGMIGPKGIPAEIVARLNAELDAVLKSPDVSGRLAEDGVITVGGTPDAFMATIRAEVARWQGFIQRTGLKLE